MHMYLLVLYIYKFQINFVVAICSYLLCVVRILLMSHTDEYNFNYISEN